MYACSTGRAAPLAKIVDLRGQLDIAQKALSEMPCEALYARVDLVRQGSGWAIMELELIEPSLYFNLDEQSPLRFVDALISFHLNRA